MGIAMWIIIVKQEWNIVQEKKLSTREQSSEGQAK